MLALALACGDRKSEPEPDLALIPNPPSTGQPVQRPHAPDCVGLWPERVQLHGTISVEVHPGPPGYGETPARDRRDSIVVLTIAAPLAVCRDSNVTNSVRPVKTARFQVTGYAHEALSHPGRHVTVFGSLTPAVWGWHYLKVILEADSIPELGPTKHIPARIARKAVSQLAPHA